MDLGHVFVGGVCGVLAVIAAAMVIIRRRREQRDMAALAAANEKHQGIPASLYPVIDPDICIGSLSCLSACPEGDILGIVNGTARLIEATHCIGHGRCEAECPVYAIKLVMGSSQRGVDLPQVNQYFETARPGVHIVGELGGMGLIKNAVNQGVQVARFMAAQVKQKKSGVLDVAVVGGGPAGLATAVTCSQLNLTCQILEQDTVGGTIAHYPRQKVVMTSPVDLPGYGVIGKQLISKEELLDHWKDVVKKTGIKINQGVCVTGIQGDTGDFVVETNKGPVRAQRVVLAVGRRGTPRKLGVPGEELAKVAYRLVDPEQYVGCSVFVVGGGDSALEAAIQLAKETDADVSISYRGDDFAKCRDKNRKTIKELGESGKVRVLLKSQVLEIRPDEVRYKGADGKEAALPNDYVLVCAGGELPLEFLKKVGVNLQRHFAQELGDKEDSVSDSGRPIAARRRSAQETAERSKTMRLTFGLLLVGGMVMAAMTFLGWDYYRLSGLDRLNHPMHRLLKASGPIGHGIGIVATGVMLTNFLYALRKRWGRLKRTGTIRGWLTVHTWVGLLTAPTIAFHAAFQSKNVLATSTSAALAVVVITGLIGRFIFSIVPSHNGRALDLKDLLNHWERLKERLEPLVRGLRDPLPVQQFLALATAPVRGGSLALFMAKMPVTSVRAWAQVRQIQPLFRQPEAYDDFTDAFWRMWRMRAGVTFYKSVKRLMGAWRLLHVVLAIFLAVMIAAHVAVELYLGYRWIFR
jgi:thioredoxin reductase/NAD-dependent dihydropyrimidine dehydrogenase PreA subunit